MSLSASISEWPERIAEWAIVRVLTTLYPELRLARYDRDRFLVASGLGRFGVTHPRLTLLGMFLLFLAALAVGALSGYLAFRAAVAVSPPLQIFATIVGCFIGLAAPLTAVYLLSRRSKRQIHLYLLRGLLDAVICPACGYSMQGHSQAGTVICPECGVAISE